MIKKELGKRLTSMIAAAGITKAEFARRLEVKPQQVNKWLKMDSFRWDQIIEFSDALEMTPQVFLDLK